MAGKVVLVTGGTSGIGRATAEGLSLLGARVAVTGRDERRAQEAARQISRAGGTPAQAFVADLSSQEQVRRLAEQVQRALPRIDVLVNNVGGYWSHRHVTADGYEHTFALNHLAPFLLTSLLLDRLQDGLGGRVVNVASAAQATGRIDFDDLQGARHYSGSRAYSQSKLASVLFTYELARRLEGTRVTANAVHPGVVSTAFGAEDPGRAQRLLVPLMRPFMRSPARGAATSIYCASAPRLLGVSGKYFANDRVARSSQRSLDEATASRLWRVSAELVGLCPTGGDSQRP
jgi:NAD(P)-dependent dehydrogenase (short-subunit alcohol dehydrogenase family)